MKRRVLNMFAVACSITTVCFGVSCTTTEGETVEDVALEADTSSEEAIEETADIGGETEAEELQNDFNEGTEDSGEGLTLEESQSSDEERAAAFDGEGAEDISPAGEADTYAETSSNEEGFESGNTTESFTNEDTEPETADAAGEENYDPFADAGNTSDVQNDTTDAAPAEDPFARFDGVVDDQAGSAATEPATDFSSSAEETAVSEDPLEGVGSEPPPVDPFAGTESPSFDTPSTEESATPTDEIGTQSSIRYLVVPGDSLSEIASRIYGTSKEWQNIAELNGMSAPYLIYPGDELEIPAFGGAAEYAQAFQNTADTVVTVEKGDSLSSIAKRVLGNGGAWKYIWKSNSDTLPNPDRLQPGQVLRFKDYRSAQAAL